MKKIAKRFELISIAIDLKESSIILNQIKKLKTFNLNEAAYNIVALLENHQYDSAKNEIKKYLKKLSVISAYNDPKVQEFQIQLRTLEKDLNDIIYTKNKLLNDINKFNDTYSNTLGGKLKEILDYKIKNAKSEEEKRRLNEQYRLLAKSQENSQATFQLSAHEENELDNMYKKLNKEINPDIVLGTFRQKAQKLFEALSRAYEKKDLATVKNIQKTIKENPKIIYGFSKINDIPTLREQSKKLQSKISEEKIILREIEHSEVCSILESTENLSEYFSVLKRNLDQKKLEIIRQG